MGTEAIYPFTSCLILHHRFKYLELPDGGIGYGLMSTFWIAGDLDSLHNHFLTTKINLLLSMRSSDSHACSKRARKFISLMEKNPVFSQVHRLETDILKVVDSMEQVPFHSPVHQSRVD